MEGAITQRSTVYVFGLAGGVVAFAFDSIAKNSAAQARALAISRRLFALRCAAVCARTTAAASPVDAHRGQKTHRWADVTHATTEDKRGRMAVTQH